MIKWKKKENLKTPISLSSLVEKHYFIWKESRFTNSDPVWWPVHSSSNSIVLSTVSSTVSSQGQSVLLTGSLLLLTEILGFAATQSRARLKQCSSSKDMWLPWWLSGKESACQCRRCGFHLWVRKIPWRRNWQPMPVLLPRKSHRQRSLVGYSPWDREESDTTSPLNNDIIPVSSFCVHSKSNMSNLIIKNFN